MADVSIMRLERELSLKVAFLEMERIFITLESELLASSTLVDQVRVRVRVRVRVSVRVSCPPPPPSSTRWEI